MAYQAGELLKSKLTQLNYCISVDGPPCAEIIIPAKLDTAFVCESRQFFPRRFTQTDSAEIVHCHTKRAKLITKYSIVVELTSNSIVENSRNLGITFFTITIS